MTKASALPLGALLMVEEQNEQHTSGKFIVENTKQHSLLSWKTCQKLKLLKLGEQVNTESTSDNQIDSKLDSL